jgi:ADP-heptose:LPS heptosyltransferase
MTPADHATAILAWLADHDPAALDDPRHALLAHADALADAANSEDEAVRSAGIAALFAGVVEPLNDSFTPRGRAAYAALFARICWRVASRDARLAAALAEDGIADETALRRRHAMLRADTHPLPADVRRIAVPSRVTIGADVLLTSVLLQRLHQRFPQAEITLLGDGKIGGLLGRLPGVRVLPLTYQRRGPLRARLDAWLAARTAAREADLVVNPDSRLDQLGLLPLTRDPARTLLWENLQREAQPRSLADLLDAWCARRFGLNATPAALPRVALDPAAVTAARAALGTRPIAAVKLDHGGNPAKALPRAGEVAILRALVARGWRVLLDRGFGDSELANSDTLCRDLGWTPRDIDDSGTGKGDAVATLAAGALADAEVVRFHGSIAGWAHHLAACGLALSYDSVGHHLAAALGLPLVTAFTGFADSGFPIAWRPRGPGRVDVVEIATAAKDDPRAWERIIGVLPAAR